MLSEPQGVGDLTDRKLAAFSRLSAGWNYGSGVPIPKSVTSTCLELKKWASLKGLTTMDAFPTDDGSVILSVYAGSLTHNFLVSPDGVIDYSLVQEETSEGRRKTMIEEDDLDLAGACIKLNPSESGSDSYVTFTYHNVDNLTPPDFSSFLRADYGAISYPGGAMITIFYKANDADSVDLWDYSDCSIPSTGRHIVDSLNPRLLFSTPPEESHWWRRSVQEKKAAAQWAGTWKNVTRVMPHHSIGGSREADYRKMLV